MAGATDKRRHEVLRAIVADYIASQEPVGSKTLVERHQLGVSSATIRNDMAVLESEGYIVQQHASSGRIPTEKGYRLFVDSIHEVKPLSAAERRAILRFLEGGVDLEDVLRRSVQLLSQLTHQAAVVQLPALTSTELRHCEVVQLTESKLLLVVITENGRVEQRNVDLDAPITPEGVAGLRATLNRALVGVPFQTARELLATLADHADPTVRPAVDRCAQVLIDTLVDAPTDRMLLAGASHLSTLHTGLPAVLDALEEQVVVLKLLANVHDLGAMEVSIGEENEDEGLHHASIVTTGYGFGGMGVVGPTFMDYPGTMSKVSAVAQYVSKVLAGH